MDVLAARTELVRRYLAAFGPATRADIADWSGLRVADFAAALEALEPLRRFRDENGRELLDVQRAPLPAADTPAPVRFLPKWDNTLLAHADRRRVLPEELRKAVIGKNGDVTQTFLVDGVVAGSWSADKKGKVAIDAVRAPPPRRPAARSRTRRRGSAPGSDEASLRVEHAHQRAVGGGTVRREHPELPCITEAVVVHRVAPEHSVLGLHLVDAEELDRLPVRANALKRVPVECSMPAPADEGHVAGLGDVLDDELGVR